MKVVFSRLASAPFWNQKPQKFTWRHTKDTLGRVKHHFVDPEIVKSFFQIIQESLLLPRLNHNIIHMCMNVAPNLTMKTILNTVLISRLDTLDPKGHRNIAKISK